MSTYLDMDTCASCLRHQNDAKNVGRTKDRLIFAIFVIATFSLLISIVVLLMQLTSTGSDKVVADLKAKYRQLEERLEQLQLLCNKNERHEVKEVQKLDRALEQDIAVDTHKQIVIGSNPYNTSLVDVSTDTDLSDLKKHRVKRQQSHRNKNKRRKKSRKNKKEKNEHTRRHVSQQGVGFVCRGNGLDYDGVFKWNVRHRHSYILGGLLNQDGRKFQLRDSGMYSVTVQINVKGRRREGYLFAPVAYWICREREGADGDWSEERLDKVILTQDDRGRIIPVNGGTLDNMPVDSMPYSGVFYLAANDRLYVRQSDDTMNDNTVDFDNTAESGHFSAHLILPEH